MKSVARRGHVWIFPSRNRLPHFPQLTSHTSGKSISISTRFYVHSTNRQLHVCLHGQDTQMLRSRTRWGPQFEAEASSRTDTRRRVLVRLATQRGELCAPASFQLSVVFVWGPFWSCSASDLYLQYETFEHQGKFICQCAATERSRAYSVHNVSLRQD